MEERPCKEDIEMTSEAIIQSLQKDEVVCLESVKQRNDLFDFMIETILGTKNVSFRESFIVAIFSVVVLLLVLAVKHHFFEDDRLGLDGMGAWFLIMVGLKGPIISLLNIVDRNNKR